ncbi:hypothetical protein NQ317_007410 [Molorchus minor]|uniref:Uncharacterized protein n=1 Tax=Molorchus minor TaxID=1323400 RepID=A0ABQ9IPT2_9CUCU|nr:hypothetical protein NQ317_007410 [Molorchus minor]
MITWAYGAISERLILSATQNYFVPYPVSSYHLPINDCVEFKLCLESGCTSPPPQKPPECSDEDWNLAQTHLTYGILAWGGATNSYLKSLEVVQKWLLKVIYNKPYTYSSNDLFHEAKVLDIKQLYCHSVLLKMYKNPGEYISHRYGTRYRVHSVVIPRAGKTIGQRCYTSYVYLPLA